WWCVMPKIKYEDWTPGPSAVIDIERAERICTAYARDGYDLTLRQLYYQFVARGWVPNTMQSYKRLGDIVNRARLAGLLDWRYIVDRTRNLRGTSHWDSPSDIIDSAAASFHLDKWADQPTRVEVWVEKEALAGVVERAASAHDVDWFSCRGYVSQSELWAAGQRLRRYLRDGQDVVILHLGDHDPSGIDMTRDIRDRLNLFVGAQAYRIDVRRIALNMAQVQQYNPPPNPAKVTDSRAPGYIAEHGDESWELDALDPATLNALISEHIEQVQDPDLYHGQQQAEQTHRRLLSAASHRWPELVGVLESTSDGGIP
ncbi:MAG TPA: hypothetical protein VFM54_16205, partial [Micromonosporaceae bacterium]|nr:hypothetical protein [Micromonosporaceae bacterium]